MIGRRVLDQSHFDDLLARGIDLLVLLLHLDILIQLHIRTDPAEAILRLTIATDAFFPFVENVVHGADETLVVIDQATQFF